VVVVNDKETGETVETIYVYGQGLISQENILDSENLTKDGATYNYYTYHTYHYNHLGSTTAITDEAGNVVERFTYGTYGELLSGTTDNIHYLYNGQYGVSTEDHSLYYMRQRYYNPEIKRFINQDIITGSIGNSQSLNRYCYVQGNPVSMTDPFGLFPLAFNGKELLHAFLNVAGMAPGILGTVADVANAALYAMEGDVASAISCGISALPAVGNMIAGGMLAVRGGKALKTANYVRNICGLIGNGATFLRSGAAAISGAVDVVQHYIETGDVDWAGIGAVGLNMFAAKLSASAVLSNGNSLRKMLSEDNVAGKIKNSLGNAAGKVKSGAKAFLADNRGMVDVDAFVSGSKGGSGVLDNANYAQKTYSNTFSAEGRKIYSDLAGEPINTIDDLVNAINSGKVNVADLPVEYIVRDGNTLILNTRTSQALTQAGIPISQWNAIDRTGDDLFEELLTGQLSRNKLTSEGISTVRPSGGQ